MAEASGGGMVLDGDAQVTLDRPHHQRQLRRATAAPGSTSPAGCNLIATRLTVTNNETHGQGGGGIIDTERPVLILDSTFSGNKAGIAEPRPPWELPDIGCPGCPIFEAAGNIAGGGALYTEGGPIDIVGSTFENNLATEEGGGISIDNFGPVTITDSTVRNNISGDNGGGIENSGMRVTFTRILVTGNKTTLDGGGIYNSSSDEFTVIDSTIERNLATNGGGFANAPDADLIIRQSSIVGNVARMPGIDDQGIRLDGGEGGGFWSKADGDALIENTTISGNNAAISGGGLFHDADGELQLSNVTIWSNSALAGGGIGVAESDFVPEVPPKANESVILRNSIVGGSRQGGSCDWYVTSEGGNVSGGGVPYVADPGPHLERQPAGPAHPLVLRRSPARHRLDPPGGPARPRQATPSSTRWPTTAARPSPTRCATAAWRSTWAWRRAPQTDQRGVVRPQNGKCDAGAYEFVGPPPPVDNVGPDTEYLTGPVQDTLETTAFTFTGSDNLTPVDELQFECRLYELELTEEPEPIAPWEPVPPELMWVQLPEPVVGAAPRREDLWIFEVRAIDRAGNIDETPAIHHIGQDTEPAGHRDPRDAAGRSATAGPRRSASAGSTTARRRSSWSTSAASTRAIRSCGSSASTRSWSRTSRPAATPSRSAPTTATRTWTRPRRATPGRSVSPRTATAPTSRSPPTADGWVDQVNPVENYVFATELGVRSASVGDPTAVPPEPVIGQNARTLVRFAVPNDAPDCELEAADAAPVRRVAGARQRAARNAADRHVEGEHAHLVQPARAPAASPPRADSRQHAGYIEWDVTAHVRGMMQSRRQPRLAHLRRDRERSGGRRAGVRQPRGPARSARALPAGAGPRLRGRWRPPPRPRRRCPPTSSRPPSPAGR